MLVLSRKVGEKLVIDGRVTVVVTRVVGNRVTLGIEAPADVHVLRGELCDQTREAVAPTVRDDREAVAPAADEVRRRAPLASMTSAVLAAHAATSP